MHKNNYYIELDNKAEKMLRNCEFLGRGHNGIVYLLPNKRIIKLFKDKKICEKEYNILYRTRKNNHFPNLYEHGPYYIVRDLVDGERLDDYIKKYGINKQIALNLIKLIKEFEELGFNKLDIRCKDLYINNKFFLMVIDPKNNYSKKVIYPRHLMKGLNKLGVLEQFLCVLKQEYPQTYELWNYRMRVYLKKGLK